VAIGNSLPRILYGKAAAFAVRGVEDLALPKTRADPDAVAAALEHAYCTQPREHASAAADLLSQSAKTTLEGIKQLKAIGSQPYAPKAPYPETELGKKLLQVARLIKADVGMEVAEIDLGGWDTHQAQGGAAGAQANLAQQVGDALAAFAADLEEKMNEVVVVTLTDFGRTAAENGTFGTDHGWANCMFLLGGPVARANAQARSAGKPRKVVTDWPGLAPDQLHQKRDLAHTTDFRDVLGEIVKVHLGNEQLQAVLPQHEFKPVGLVAV
jgi:uncharacterized protein (DUF1501 family)